MDTLLYAPLSGFLWTVFINGLGLTGLELPQSEVTGESPLEQTPLLVSTTLATSATRPSTPFPTFNSQPLDRQLKLYLQYVAESGPPDVLVVGSSRAYQGINPIVLQQSLSRRGYSGATVFNFGVNGATAQVVDLKLRQVLTPDQLPRLILWADGARAFNSGRVDSTYNNIIASPGYKRLVAGIRPTLPQPEIATPPPFCLRLSAGLLEDNLPEDALPEGTLKESRSSSFSGVTPPPTKNQQLCIQPLDETNRFSPSGWVIQASPLPAKPASSPAALGFNTVTTRFNPTSYFRQYPRVPGSYDADYRNFTLQGSQSAAMNRVIRFARSRRIPIVFVNMPLTQIYFDSTRTYHEQQFRAYIQRFANYGQLTFYDYGQRWLNQHHYFADPSHLNQLGAAHVSNQLGQDLKLPRTPAK
ncbi:hypothetical protein J5X98_12210 [Leptothermofonsia sichuanensis E412]|uniref:hypothetical protein n=1 Tax=Leptothermofonsia sichuanensis TaxID=2917832 RepID=UPI001CA6ECEA|nr:hypothetical protein [Leptothermofonsia sichuanensis]QZZ23034.1 hypothetical protein J5X98_12210 [Leptothermofonsia sichuanensis E412]